MNKNILVKEAAVIAHNAIFANHGQNCCAGSRTFVHSKIYVEFVQYAKQLALKIKVGDPFNSETIQGPQVDEEMFNKVMNFIKFGKEEGAVLETGGERHGNVGFFIKVLIFYFLKLFIILFYENFLISKIVITLKSLPFFPM